MKKFIFVAYDITIDKIRRRLVKYLENYGHRIQYSVFCLRVRTLKSSPLPTRTNRSSSFREKMLTSKRLFPKIWTSSGT